MTATEAPERDERFIRAWCCWYPNFCDAVLGLAERILPRRAYMALAKLAIDAAWPMGAFAIALFTLCVVSSGDTPLFRSFASDALGSEANSISRKRPVSGIITIRVPWRLTLSRQSPATRVNERGQRQVTSDGHDDSSGQQ
jgi:hypothetical protein